MQEIPVLSNVCSTHAKSAYKQYHAQLTPLRMIRNFPLRKCHGKKIKSRNSFNENVHQPKRRIVYEILVLVVQMSLCVSVYC